MQTPQPQHITPPSRAQLGSPGDLLHWAREQFSQQVEVARIGPQEAAQGIKDVLAGLGLPPRIIVRCRVSEAALIDVAFEWGAFEARQQHDPDTGSVWYLYMPAKPLEPLPQGITTTTTPTGAPT